MAKAESNAESLIRHCQGDVLKLHKNNPFALRKPRYTGIVINEKRRVADWPHLNGDVAVCVIFLSR